MVTRTEKKGAKKQANAQRIENRTARRKTHPAGHAVADGDPAAGHMLPAGHAVP